jgi:3-hydroxybutyrate dehydrogenase
MASAAAIEAMISTVLQSFGRLDVLVNNAGIQHVAPIAEFPVEKWQAILAINLSSAFHTTRCALPAMRAQRWGRIINIASAHGLVASPFKSAYVAAKHGLVGLTKSPRWRPPRRGSPATRSAPATCSRRWSRRR